MAYVICATKNEPMNWVSLISQNDLRNKIKAINLLGLRILHDQRSGKRVLFISIIELICLNVLFGLVLNTIPAIKGVLPIDVQLIRVLATSMRPCYLSFKVQRIFLLWMVLTDEVFVNSRL